MNTHLPCRLLILLMAVSAGCRSGDDAAPADAASTTQQEGPLASSNNGDAAAATQTTNPVLTFATLPADCGLDFQNRNGEQALQYTILESLGGGVGLVDVDQDGWDDVLLPGGGRMRQDASPEGLPCGVFRNLRTDQYEDQTGNTGIGNTDLYSHGVARGDFDNDGFADFLVTGYGPPQLFHNLGDGTFTRHPFPADDRWSSSAAWGDVNGDGCLDVYVARYVDWSSANNPLCEAAPGQQDVCPPRDFTGLPDSLYVSDGSGRFEDATDAAGVTPDGKGLGVILADLDDDRDVDIYVTNDTVPNHLFQNTGDGRLTDMSLVSGGSVSGSGVPQGSMGVQLMDFNSDGRFDVWVTNYEKEASALYEGIGSFLFRHVSQRTKLTEVGALFVGWGVLSLDADHDGDEDVFVANGHVIRHPQAAPLRQTSLLMQNDGGTKFRNVTATGGDYVSQPHMARGCAAGDLDHDGDVDIVVSHTNERAEILRNTTHAAHWLQVSLVGVESPRDPVGTRVVITTSTQQMHRQFIAGGSYASTGSRRLHFGLGPATSIDALTVTWPSGREQTFTQLAVDQTLCLVEGRSPVRLTD